MNFAIVIIYVNCCESISVCVHQYLWVGLTTKFGSQRKISIEVYTENLKTTNLRIHKLVFLPKSMN